MMSDLDAGSVASWRAQLVQGAAIWSAPGHRVVAPGHAEALSGRGGTDGNVVFCFDGTDGSTMRATVSAIRGSAVPAVAIIGAAALGWVQILVDADLVCVGVSAFMHLPADRVDPSWRDPAVRRLRPSDLPAGRELVAAAYADGSPMSEIALPDEALDAPDRGLWGIEVDGVLTSVVTTAADGDATSIWSMSTPAALQRRGFGRRLLRSVLAEEVAAGTRRFLLYSSPSGEALYRKVGFDVVEHWQEWSRPRWIPGRT